MFAIMPNPKANINVGGFWDPRTESTSDHRVPSLGLHFDHRSPLGLGPDTDHGPTSHYGRNPSPGRGHDRRRGRYGPHQDILSGLKDECNDEYRPTTNDRDGNLRDDIGYREYLHGSQRQIPARPPSKPLSLPRQLEFNGKSNWHSFKQEFDRYADAADWSIAERRDALCWSVVGKAGDFYGLLMEMDDSMPYMKIRREFDKRFPVKKSSETLRAEFQSECQHHGEKLADWADRILALGETAYQGSIKSLVVKRAINIFCEGCLDREAGEHVSTQPPKSMSDAIDAIEWYQHLVHKSTKKRVMSRLESKVEHQSESDGYRRYIYAEEERHTKQNVSMPTQQCSSPRQNKLDRRSVSLSEDKRLTKDKSSQSEDEPKTQQTLSDVAEKRLVAVEERVTAMAQQVNKLDDEQKAFAVKTDDRLDALERGMLTMEQNLSCLVTGHRCFNKGGANQDTIRSI